MASLRAATSSSKKMAAAWVVMMAVLLLLLLVLLLLTATSGESTASATGWQSSMIHDGGNQLQLVGARKLLQHTCDGPKRQICFHFLTCVLVPLSCAQDYLRRPNKNIYDGMTV